MFIQMGKVYVRMNRIETLRIDDGWLKITTMCDREYCRKLEQGTEEKVLFNLLAALADGVNK